MHRPSRLLALSIVVVSLLGAAANGAAPKTAKFTPSEASLKGEWVWAFQGRLVRYNYAQLGIASFDGKGGCTLTLRENSGANGGYEHNSSACAYEVDKNGLGRIDFALDGEAGVVDIAVGPRDVRLASPDPGNAGAGWLRRASVVEPSELSGRWTFSMTGTIAGENLGGAGLMTFDGKGKCGQTLSYNYGSGGQTVETDACTYQIEKDGIGLAQMTYSNGTGGDSYFVTGNGTKELYLLTIAEAEILSGWGTKQ